MYVVVIKPTVLDWTTDVGISDASARVCTEAGG